MRKCDECGAPVKAENLRSHYAKAHPGAAPPKVRRYARPREPLTRTGKRFLATVAAIVVAAILVYLLVAGSAPRTGPRVGDRAPDFSLAATTGQTITLSDLHGNVVLLEFFDVDCPYCQAEAPTLAALYQNFSTHITFLSIDMNFDGLTDTPGRITAYQQQYSNPWVFMLDPNGANGISLAYGVTGTPTIFLINGNGTVAFSHSGIIDYAALAHQLSVLQ